MVFGANRADIDIYQRDNNVDHLFVHIFCAPQTLQAE